TSACELEHRGRVGGEAPPVELVEERPHDGVRTGRALTHVRLEHDDRSIGACHRCRRRAHHTRISPTGRVRLTARTGGCQQGYEHEHARADLVPEKWWPHHLISSAPMSRPAPWGRESPSISTASVAAGSAISRTGDETWR